MNKQLMEQQETEEKAKDEIEVPSEHLDRIVRIDFYFTSAVNNNNDWSLLLVNDGQDLVKMDFGAMLAHLDAENTFPPALVVGIHCGPDRKNEYGMSVSPDHQGWGAKAAAYEEFIVTELLPLIEARFPHVAWTEKGFAGFSLGALSAFDISWNHPEIFSTVGVFSGSLWWRSVSKDDKSYNGALHRMMHQQVKHSSMRPGMRFFFECGEHDESEDRNRNGVIDSIDDTIDLMRELNRKGYKEGRDIFYLQMPDGKHDVPSWAKAFPTFLLWALRKPHTNH